MDKNKILEALNSVLGGAAAGGFRDELETAITLVVNGRHSDKLLTALNAIQDGEEVAYYHAEIKRLITLVANTRDEDIAAAWDDFSTDTE